MSEGKGAAGHTKRQSAEVRGNIQKGYTGDKVPGFDPAAAPLETDAEAAGTPEPLPGNAALERKSSVGNANASSYGSAMRPFDGERQAHGLRTWLLIAVVVVVLIVIAIFVLQF